MRANFVLSGVAAGIRRNAAMTIALVLSTAIALGFVGAALLANTEINKFTQVYEGKLNVSVYLCPTLAQPPCTAKTTPAQTSDIQNRFASDPLVASATYVSEQEQYDRAKQIEPATGKYLKVGALPASFTVHLKNLKNDYPKFVDEYKSVPGVYSINNQYSTIKKLLDVIDGARLFALMIALVVLFASILLIANTIQTAAAQRRNETSIMRLVGASRWMTELPFMLEAVVAAAVGGLISIALIWIGKNYLLDGVFQVPVESGVIPNLSTNDILVAGGSALILGIILSGLTAFATLRLYVRL